jgi:16S rRNA processing protein RimM
VKKSPNELPIGRIAGLFGVRGELKCDPTRSGRALFVPGATLRCGDEMVIIEAVREHKGRLLVSLAQARDASAAERFSGATFFAPKDALDVEPGEYLDVDLAGCTVRSSDGRVYGTVERVEHYPASDMLVINGRMLPMVRAFIASIDVNAKQIVVHDLPAELLD